MSTEDDRASGGPPTAEGGVSRTYLVGGAATKSKTFFGIQILRGLAACAVVAFHVALNLRPLALTAREGQGPTPAFATNFVHLHVPVFGNAGVDLFFLISGFVIVWTTRNCWREAGTWREFLRKRVIRIFPLYWLLTTARLGFFLAAPQLFHQPIPAWNAIASYLLIPSWNGNHDALPVIDAGWTLCFEMFFYYVCAICLAAGRRPALAATPVFIVLAYLGTLRSASWDAAATLLNPLLLEFVAGMWIAEFANRGMASQRTVGWLALLAAGCAALICSDLLPVATAYRLRVIVWGIPAAAILFSSVMLEDKLNFRKARLLLVVGDASYSIYLTHVVFLRPIVAYARQLDIGFPGEWAAFGAIVCVGISIGVTAYFFVERPVLLFIRRASKARARRRDPATPVMSPRM